jgi:DNA polymerase III gamma/tau subunit
MNTSLYKKYRPKSLNAVIGQEGAVKSLQKMIDKENIPHAILLTGPSGCGKTTIARILKAHLDCHESDFSEINCADFKGIDMIRDIRRAVGLCPMFGGARIWLIDEAQKLTGDAQNAFLKLLEDTPDHAYFMLCTTDPQKLIKTIHTRCSEVKLVSMSDKALKELIESVCNKEKMELGEDVIDAIIEGAEGSARKALVILEQVGYLETEQEQLAAVSYTASTKEAAINLARALIYPGAKWDAVSKILKEIKDEPESVRYLVLSYSRSVLLGGGKMAARAYKVIDAFSPNFYDSKHAGLAAACWEVLFLE